MVGAGLEVVVGVTCEGLRASANVAEWLPPTVLGGLRTNCSCGGGLRWLDLGESKMGKDWLLEMLKPTDFLVLELDLLRLVGVSVGPSSPGSMAAGGGFNLELGESFFDGGVEGGLEGGAVSGEGVDEGSDWVLKKDVRRAGCLELGFGCCRPNRRLAASQSRGFGREGHCLDLGLTPRAVSGFVWHNLDRKGLVAWHSS